MWRADHLIMLGISVALVQLLCHYHYLKGFMAGYEEGETYGIKKRGSRAVIRGPWPEQKGGDDAKPA